MGSGCASGFNSRNQLPSTSNIEEYLKYYTLIDETKNGDQISPEELKSSLSGYLPHNPRLQEMPNTNPNSNKCSLKSSYHENIHHKPPTKGSTNLVGECMPDADQTHVFNSPEECKDPMSEKPRMRSYQTATSSELGNVDRDNSFFHPEIVNEPLDQIWKIGKNVDHTRSNNNGVHFRKDREGAEAASGEVSILKGTGRGGSLPVRESCGKKGKIKWASEAGTVSYFGEPDLTKDWKWHNKEEVCSWANMTVKNAFDEGNSISLVSDSCNLPTLLSRKETEIAKKSKLAFLPRVSYVKSTISERISDSSCGKAAFKDVNNIECGWLRNQQPCSPNSKIQQFQVNLSREKVDIDDCDSSKSGDRRNSSVVLRKSFGEVDRYVPITPSVSSTDKSVLPNKNSVVGCGKKQLSFAPLESSYPMGDSKYPASTWSPGISKALEFPRSENTISKDSLCKEGGTSSLDLKKRFSRELARRNSILVDEEMLPKPRYDLPADNEETSRMKTSDQPEQNPTPEQSPRSTVEINYRDQRYFWSPLKALPVISSNRRERVASPTKKQRANHKWSINPSNCTTAVWDAKGISKLASTQKIEAKEISKWTVKDVQDWIRGLDNEVRRYCEVFKSHQIDGERLSVLTPGDFSRFIPNQAHRDIVMKALEKVFTSTGKVRWESESKFLQHYELKELIKMGMFSTTHIALDLQHGNRMCAVKLISSEKSKKLNHPDIVAKEVAFKRWLATSSSIQHPNMIAYYDHTKNERYRGTLYKYILVREHYPLNLELLVSKGIGLGECISRHILHQIVSLLCFLRTKKIGHFDLRPVNILFTPDEWQVKITDWGSFKQFTTQSTRLNRSSELVHRGVYTAPEMYNNWKYGLAADSWSLGVILFGIITGNVIFSSTNASDLTYKALREDNFKAFGKSLDEKLSWSLAIVSKSFIFNLVRYNADDRLNLQNAKDYKYYSGILPSEAEYTATMSRAFQQCLRREM